MKYYILIILLICNYAICYRCFNEKHHAECTSKSLCNPGIIISGLCLPGSGLECCLKGTDTKCANIGGTCTYKSKCHITNNRVPELCPGTSNIVCCLPKNTKLPSHKNIIKLTKKPEKKSITWKQLVENRISILSDYLLANMTLPDAKKQSTKLCWPVSRNSTLKKTVTDVSWGSYREHGRRCHAGVDIFTATPGEVISIAHGQVINIIPKFTYCRHGWGLNIADQPRPVSAVMIYYADLGITVNYGELDPDKIRVRLGELVNRGTTIGLATYCGMLHFEVYKGRVMNYHTWRPPKGVVLPPLGNICSVKYTKTPEFIHTNLKDPRPLLSQLQGRFCGT